MEAFAAYVEALRKRAHLSQHALANEVGTTSNTISRIESRGQKPELDLYFRLIDRLGGSDEDARALINDEHATIEDGRRLADQRLKQRAIANSEAFREAKRIAAIPERERAEELRSRISPEVQDQILAFLIGILQPALSQAAIEQTPDPTHQVDQTRV